MGDNLSSIAVVTSFDKNYMEYSKVMINTLSKNYHGKDILSVYCLVPHDILNKQDEYIKSVYKNNVSIKFVSSEKFNNAKYLVEREQYTKNVWHRIFAGSLLPDVEKIIYIDPDIIVLRDIEPLINYKNLSPFSAYIEDDFQGHCLDIYGSQDVVYFNDGVFIADLNYWREQDIESKLIDYAKKNNTKFVDQDAFNYVMRDIVRPLPVTFNFFVDKQALYYSVESPLLVHFSGPIKPWNSDMDGNKYCVAWQEEYKLLTMP
jgi:lipopolysaccharide biosynthesis glycosyltransferase